MARLRTWTTAIVVLGLAARTHAQCGTAKEVDEVSIAKGHTCVRLRDGAVKCWGINMTGQLGDGTTTHRATPTRVADLCGVRSISAGGESTCAALTDGTVRCWGLMFRSDKPLEIHGVGGVTQVVVGTVSACGLHADGTVSCWSGAEKPLTIDVTGVSELAAWTGQHALFVGRKADGSVWRWLGDALPPARVSIPPARRISCGAFKCCAVLEDATATCWDPGDPIAAPVPGLRDVVEVAAGGHRYCAVLKDRSVRCWDFDGNIGTFGDGTTGDHPLPLPIPGLSNVRQIAPGNFNACAIVVGGALKCWGGPTRFVGMVGDGSAETRLTPVDVAM